MGDKYFIHKNYNDTVYRLKDGELELYSGNGKWTPKAGLYQECTAGTNTDLVQATGEEIKEAMAERDKTAASNKEKEEEQ